jgi:hypothetical protein
LPFQWFGVSVRKPETVRTQPDEEVVKAQNGNEAQLIFGLQSSTDLTDFLNRKNVEDGDPKS